MTALRLLRSSWEPCRTNFSASAIQRTPLIGFWLCLPNTASKLWPIFGDIQAHESFRISIETTSP